jgi:hypothetical protein
MRLHNFLFSLRGAPKILQLFGFWFDYSESNVATLFQVFQVQAHLDISYFHYISFGLYGFGFVTTQTFGQTMIAGCQNTVSKKV